MPWCSVASDTAPDRFEGGVLEALRQAAELSRTAGIARAERLAVGHGVAQARMPSIPQGEKLDQLKESPHTARQATAVKPESSVYAAAP